MAKRNSQDPPSTPIPRGTVGVHQYRDALRDAVELPIATRGVLYVLAQFMNADGTNAYPRLERLAASCQLRQRAVAKHLALAVETGYLIQTSAGYRGQTAVYRASIPMYRWDAAAERIVQPNPVAEPVTRPHECSGCRRPGCTGKHESRHADGGFKTETRHDGPESLHDCAGFEGESLHKNARKPARVCSPTSLSTPDNLLGLPRTSTHSDVDTSPSMSGDIEGAELDLDDESGQDAHPGSSEAGVKPETRQDEDGSHNRGTSGTDPAVGTEDSVAADGLGGPPDPRFPNLTAEDLARIGDLTAHLCSPDYEKLERLLGFVEEQVGGYWPGEDHAAGAMLERREHYRKVINTILKQRERGYVA